jgi:hypothetical protein
MSRDRSAIPSNDRKFNDYYKYLTQLVIERTTGVPVECRRCRRRQRTGLLTGMWGGIRFMR